MSRKRWREVGMDETIDIAGANARGETPTFHVTRKCDNVEVEEHEDGTATWRFSYEGKLLEETKDGAKAESMLAGFINVADALQRREMKRKLSAQFRIMRERRAAENVVLEEKRARIKACIELFEWLQEPFVLQRQDGSAMHRMDAAADVGRMFVANGADRLNTDIQRYYIEYSDELPPPFIVTHDWAKAIGPAISEGEGDFKPPYSPVSLFEFRITGRQVMAFVHDDGAVDAYAESGDYWVHVVWHGQEMDGDTSAARGRELIETLRTQIRAVCIAIDAEVAVADTVRVPERLNRSRVARGRKPMSDHHVVHLAKRTSKPAPLPDDHTGEKRRTPRLHFVRGHWKHFATHRTWVKWFLRGDPDLGFIEKEYRL
jgi:hypothetical protein